MPDLEQGLARLQNLDAQQRSRLRSLVEKGAFECACYPFDAEPTKKAELILDQARGWGYQAVVGEERQADLDRTVRSAGMYLVALHRVTTRPRLWREFFLWSLGEPDFPLALESMRNLSAGQSTDLSGLEGRNLVIGMIRNYGFLAPTYFEPARKFITQRIDAGDEELRQDLEDAVKKSIRDGSHTDPRVPAIKTLKRAIGECWLTDSLWLMTPSHSCLRIEELKKAGYISSKITPSLAGRRIVVRDNSLYQRSKPKILCNVRHDGSSCGWRFRTEP